MYLAKNGNYSYVIKPLGSATVLLDKVIFGGLISSFLLLLLFGPIFFFSEYGAFIQENPVKQAHLELSFVVNKTLSEYDLEHRSASRKEVAAHPEDHGGSRALTYTSSVPYTFFVVNHPNLNNYTEESWEKSPYRDWTEMKFFDAKQVQEVISTEYPDRAWDIGGHARRFMKRDLLSAINGKASFTLDFKVSYRFERDLPKDAQTSSGEALKSLNFSTYIDCLTGLQLRAFAEFDCTSKSQDDVVLIHIHNAYSNELVLGPTKATHPLFRKTLSQDYQKYDLELEYQCGERWLARSSTGPNLIDNAIKFMEVDRKTCEPLTEEDRAKLDAYKASR